MRKRIRLVLLLACCGSRLTLALAEPFNLEPPPIGDRPAGMGGTGVTLVDPTAIYFNPAGLTALPAGWWHGSVSGYVEVGRATQDQSFLDKDMEVATLDGMLGFAGLARAFSWGGVGLAFVSPERRTEEALRRFGPLETTILQEVLTFQKGSLFIDSRTTTLEAGPAVGVKVFSDTLSMGGHVLYSARRSQIARAYSLTDEKGNFYALQTSFQQLSQTLRLGYGIRWQVWPALALGASTSFHLPVRDTISVSRLTATIDQEQVRDLLPKLLAGEITQQQAVEAVFKEGFSTTHGDFERPKILRWGALARWPEDWVLAAEVNLFFPTEQDLPELPPPFDRAKGKTVVNVHGGAEKGLIPGLRARAGFYTDFSDYPSIDGLTRTEIEDAGYDRRTPRDMDLYHFTAGLAFGDDPRSVSVSLNYAWGRGKIIDVLGNVRPETRRDLIVGLGTTIEF